MERSEELAPALRRTFDSGKPAAVNVVADCDGPGKSQPWLRLKSGNMYSRGLNEIGQEILQHFDVSLIDALCLRKATGDNGTHIPLSFIARLTGNDEAELHALANERGYMIDK